MTIFDFFTLLIKASALLGAISFVVLVLTYAERKALARIQQRLGPTRVGYRGILQPGGIQQPPLLSADKLNICSILLFFLFVIGRLLHRSSNNILAAARLVGKSLRASGGSILLNFPFRRTFDNWWFVQ